jgi:hypothetical protein
MLPKPPKGGVDLSFNPIREGWSIYTTKDLALIKIRQILMRIVLLSTPEDGSGRLAASGSLAFAVVSPDKGPPDSRQYTAEQIVQAITQPHVEYDTVKEDWNEYDAEGVGIGVKVVATNIAKTRLFDGMGEPIYWVNYQIVVRPITTPEDKAKLQKIWSERGPKQPTPTPAHATR